MDFLDAERSNRATQFAYRQALADYMTSLEQLKEAVGTRTFREDGVIIADIGFFRSHSQRCWRMLICRLQRNDSGSNQQRRRQRPRTSQLFTIPRDQMSHIQVLTVQPVTLTRTLR